MREIQLTQGQVTLVDEQDFCWLSQHKWCAQWSPRTKSFYAQRGVYPGGKKILLHREIMGLKKGDPREVHHVNGDTLDNRRSNLKIVTVTEHKNEHRNDPRRDVSKYGIGIYRRSSGRFLAQVSIDGKRYNIGTHDTPQEAQAAREEFLSKREKETVCIASPK